MALMGPGQWLAFELDAGAFDLFDVTIDRAEYDNVTYGDMTWRDGFSGRAWLSRDTCVKGANTSIVQHDGYCPHGGELYVNTHGHDVSPHRFCSRFQNYSYQLNLQPGTTYVRDAIVDPDEGTVDDLGYSDVLGRIAERRHALDQSMHYPTQLLIRDQIAELEHEAKRLSRSNSTWRRRWHMRMCTSSLEAGKYFLSIYGDEALDTRAHAGLFIIRFTNIHFDRSALGDQVPRRGCLQRGGSESYQLQTSQAFPELTSLGLAEVRPYYLESSDNHVTTLTVRRSEAPTQTMFDARVEYPSLRISMSACDVSAAQTWFFTVTLSDDAPVGEVFFEIVVTLEDSTRTLGDSVEGYACCGQYKYYAFPAVDERVAPSAFFNLSHGRVKAIYWRYGSCPREELHVSGGVCTGWCILDWYRLFSQNLGKPQYLSSSTLPVPYGIGEEPDKRRGGTWYLGIQALDDFAQYSLTTSHRAPSVDQGSGCDRLDRYCNMPDRFKDIEKSAATTRTCGMATSSVSIVLAVWACVALLHR